MKRLTFLLVFLVFLFSGCSQLQRFVSVSVESNFPDPGVNRVLVTCPSKLGKVKIGKIVLYKDTRFSTGVEYVVLPGKLTKVFADGIFGDEPLVLTGFVYDTRENVVGRISERFDFSQGDSRYPKIKQWNITENQIFWTEGSFFWGVVYSIVDLVC